MNQSKTLQRSVPAVLVVILLFYSALIFLYAGRFHGNFSGFACIGDRFPAPGIVTEEVYVLPRSRGYDGQFFFFAAHDPFLRRGVWRYMDVPAYRYQRIAYPGLAALFALGRPSLIPLFLVGVNVASILLGSLFVARLLDKEGLSPWYAIFYGTLSGFLLCVLRDLAGPVAMAFLVGGFYYYSERSYWPAALFLAAALLTREAAAPAVVALLLHAAFFRTEKGRAWPLLLSFLPFLVWGFYLYFRLHDPPWRGGAGNFGRPLVSLLDYLNALFQQPGRWGEKSYLGVFLPVSLLTFLLALREVFRSRSEVAFALLFYSVLMVFMTRRIWIEPWSYGRVTLPVPVFLVLSFARTRDRLYLIPLAGQAILTVVTIWWLNF